MNPEPTPFQTCPCCSRAWPTRDQFLADPALMLNGYQADFERLESGLFLFTHLVPECKSTMAVEAVEFMDVYQGPRYAERRTGQAECPGYCLERDQLARCDALCECAFVREVVHIVARRHQPRLPHPTVRPFS